MASLHRHHFNILMNNNIYRWLKLGAIHRSCAERYLNIGHKEKCELCNYTYEDDTRENPFTDVSRRYMYTSHMGL